MSELDNIANLIKGLEAELEWCRQHADPMNASHHKYMRMMLTLAKSIQELAKKPNKEEDKRQ